MNSVATVETEPTSLVETAEPILGGFNQPVESSTPVASVESSAATPFSETPATPEAIKTELAHLLATTKLYPNPKVAAVANALQPYKDEIVEIYDAGCNARMLADKMAKLLQIVISTKVFMEFLRTSGSVRALNESTKPA